MEWEQLITAHLLPGASFLIVLGDDLLVPGDVRAVLVHFYCSVYAVLTVWYLG